MVTEFIDRCKIQCLNGQTLDRSDIVRLLEIPVGSEDDRYLRAAAREVAAALTGNRGYIWCAVGMDYAPCPMNCRFCSFGEAWNLIPQARPGTIAEIRSHIRSFVAGGAAYIVLRTTEFYSLDTLLDYIPQIRAAVPGEF